MQKKSNDVVHNVSNEFQKFVEDIRNKDLGVKKSDKMKVGATELGKSISTD